jgi:hypothetical protein
MLEADRQNSGSSSRTPVPIDRAVRRAFRAVRRFAGNRRLQILSNPAFHPMTPVRLPIVRSSQNEGSVQKRLWDSTDELHSSVDLTIAKKY